MSTPQNGWIDSVYESLLLRDGKEIACTFKGSSGVWWWSVAHRVLDFAITREFAKAAVEKEVAK